jgi:hypothetical protein
MMSIRSITRYLRRLTPVLLIAGGASCTRVHRAPAEPPAVLRFTNESLDQATVYAVVPGLYARRIGTVMAGRTEWLVVPPDLATRGSLNIVARLLAHSTVPQTGIVAIYPGEEYEVRLPIDGKLLSFLRSR